MNTELIVRTLLISLLVVGLPLALVSQERKGKIQVTVHGGTSNSPVKGADVHVRSSSGEFEDSAQTNNNGVASLSNVPHGTMLIQITARGWRTAGGQHVLNGERLNVSVTLDKVEAMPSPSPNPSPTPSPTQ